MKKETEFTPYLTPQEMLEYGVFEGKYLNDSYGEGKEFPGEWFQKARIAGQDAPPDATKYNFFGIKSRQSLREWKKNKWIYGNDERGWFQWYCRYFMGRRDPEVDAIQIKRWKSFNARHGGQLRKYCGQDRNLTCRVKQRQAILQWAGDAFWPNGKPTKRKKNIRKNKK